jgi:hypothetical protein
VVGFGVIVGLYVGLGFGVIVGLYVGNVKRSEVGHMVGGEHALEMVMLTLCCRMYGWYVSRRRYT